MRKGHIVGLLIGGLIALPASAFFGDGFERPFTAPPSASEAARFLTQASFGPTLDEIARLQGMSLPRWIDEQMALPASLHLPRVEQRIALEGVDEVWGGERHEEWIRIAVTGQDQLRQRVAFALSQILVVSERSGALEGNPTAVASYYDVLVRHAFGNYRDLLEEVTLHPSMGQYLSMFRNRKGNQSGTLRPDENFAREIMQLFSIGLVQLNPDGSVRTQGGQPIPTYDQETIRGFAAVFTGWNLSTCAPTRGDWNTNSDTPGSIVEYQNWWEWEYCRNHPGGDVHWKLAEGYRTPMRAWNSYHQALGSKQLLRYPGVARGRVDANGVLAEGGSAEDNLDAALDNIFHHPNVGPFLARRLIQRLVTSNPTPAYVARVAAAFADDNGDAPGGVRGNLGAVIRAILLDREARQPATTACSSAGTGCVGKLREPLMRVVQLFRALQAQPSHPQGFWREGYLDFYTAQAAMRSPTVFNFFSPDYALPGPEIVGRGLVSPEFQITTDTYVIRMINEIAGKVGWTWAGNPGLPTSGYWRPVVVSLDRDMAIAHDPAALVDRYDLLFTGGQLPAPIRQIIIDHVTAEAFFNWRSDAQTRRLRVQDALWLVTVSPSYVVEK
ncbi:DUF1800 domain-containing protein [Pseudomarimonas salicorniae]|uniref:DUF1800 domain-containing protein n=1 Tax=Pseudomarimonas salicorniae TaxID=2933270 RepID=A0ABT0GHK8_9GAMM|nr:DUF1800 family protein [Lysobacter sp. CAU 1642]MCK7594035.1 DUF1800 domain-containing protein [Lysobacter sp. CAU 1642]